MALVRRTRRHRYSSDSDTDDVELPNIILDENRFVCFTILSIWSPCVNDVAQRGCSPAVAKYGQTRITDTSMYQQLTLRSLKTMWCRLVAHYFEWVAGIPELRLIDVRKRINLIALQLCKVICLTVSYWTYTHNHNGVIFGSGICFNPSESKEEGLRNYVTELGDVLQLNVVSAFRTLRISREEYLLMKLIAFFDYLLLYGIWSSWIHWDTVTPGPRLQLSPADRHIVDMALKRYQSALVEHILTEVDQMHLSQFTIQNSGNLHGTLTCEIHVNVVRSYST
ncbi:unnamed protein product [Nippostrongylus brasiliensis]|uniref:NR LBD domain-containing protein n=1 Tax=Nippostrongylus brasiliensis TaxID=27835 RepID=A0A0N4YIQ0_NIPBR|nr:unnamed protein product [Nippostrongylus brasiliensis]